MSTHSGNSNGNCSACVKKRSKGHRHAREAKYCPRHQCENVDSSGAICTNRKKAADIRCTTHATCKARGCNTPRTLDERGIPNDWCVEHSCVVTGCDEGKVHDPNRDVHNDLCASHLLMVCAISTCLEWKHESGNYCRTHTCLLESCLKKIANEVRPFCIDHDECNVPGCPKPKCQFGNRFEPVCRDHYIPPCVIESCTRKASMPSRHCELHSCRNKGCTKEARPGLGRPFCSDHKCTDSDCHSLRNFSEVEGTLRMNTFCPIHECRVPGCAKHNFPNKTYCNSHCCTKEDCLAARDRDPRFGALCYTHYEEKIKQKAVEDRLAELRLREERDTRAAEEARKRSEEVRRQARLREERLREDREAREAEIRSRAEESRRQAQLREEREAEIREEARVQAVEAEWRRRHTNSPSGRRRQRYDERYEDEGYRSHHSSGDFGQYERFSEEPPRADGKGQGW